MRIYLVGYMGAGKSSTSKRLAGRLGWEAYDTDRLFEARFRISINDFFHKYDAELFRRLEAQVLRDTLAYDDAVIATGGGTPCFNNNMEWMNGNGLTVFLNISPQSAFTRLSQSKVKRPILVDKSPEEMEAFILQNYTERMPFYEQAQLTVKGENLDLDALVNAIQAR